MRMTFSPSQLACSDARFAAAATHILANKTRRICSPGFFDLQETAVGITVF